MSTVQINNQRPEPQDKGDGLTLDLHSMFYTLQGEGPFTGHRSVFVRLAGCNLQCPGCDTEYTQGRERVKVTKIVTDVLTLSLHNNAQKCLVVITGGEPFRQNIGPLVKLLNEYGHMVQIETNGVLPPPELLYIAEGCFVVCSPKTSHINEAVMQFASAFKYVIDADSVAEDDGLPLMALGHKASPRVARPQKDMPIYVNPFDSGDPVKNQANLDAAARSALKHGYILGVQLHKLANLP